MLVFRCVECDTLIKMKDEFAGKQVRCPTCKAVVTAPAESAEDDSTAVSSSPRATSRRGDDEDTPRARNKSARHDAGDRARPDGPPVGSGKALTCLLLSLANCLCLPFILSLPSIIIGILALMDISRARGHLTGKGMAITGIVLAILGNIAYAVLIVVILVAAPAALMPVALRKVQQSATRLQTENNLKQIGIGMHNFASVNNGRLPPAPGMDLQNPEPPRLSWRVGLLPFIEQDQLFRRFDPKRPWDQQPNQALLANRPMAYGTPINEPADPSATFIQVCTGPNTLFPDTKTPVRLGAIPDGTSNTIFAVQATVDAVPWTKPADIVMTPPGQPLPPALVAFQQNMVVLMCDGSVRTINRVRLSDQTLRMAIDPRDGQPLPADWDAR